MTAAGTLLRDASPADVPAILDFVRMLAVYERQAERCTAAAGAMHRALFGAPPLCRAMLAWQGERPVGLVIWTVTFAPLTATPGYWVANIIVAEEARGQGIGRAFFAELARRLAEEGGTTIGWGVKRWNAPSIGFYRSLGAEPDPGVSDRMSLSGAPLAALAEAA